MLHKKTNTERYVPRVRHMAMARVRNGMPPDQSSNPKYYDGSYDYLKSLGI